MNKKNITYRDHDQGTKEALFEAQNKYNVASDQVEWLLQNKGYSSQQRLFAIIYIVQHQYSMSNSRSGDKVELNPIQIDYMMRGIIDALRHMQDDLPKDVWRSIENNLENHLLTISKQGDR